MKKIHIINPYATLNNEGWRKYRTNIVAEKLSKYYDVVLWISNIDHRTKSNRLQNSATLFINDNLVVNVVKSRKYKSNSSIDRILYERDFIKKVFDKSIDLSMDCIIFTDPCIFYSDYISLFKKKHKQAKIVIDILDLWPEAFLSLFPSKISFIGKVMLSPMFFLRSRYYKKVDAFVAVTNDYLSIAGNCLKRTLNDVVYIGIDPADKLMEKTIIKELPEKNRCKWIVYAGTLGVNYDIKSILDAALLLEVSEYDYKIIIAGAGPLEYKVRSFILENKLTKTIFLGRLHQDELNYLYSMSDVLLSTYLSNSSVSMPVKAYDAILYNLPIINSLGRELSYLIQQNEIGIQYKAESSKDLFDKIILLLEDKPKYNQIRFNLSQMIDVFSIDVQYSKYVNLINNLLDE